MSNVVGLVPTKPDADLAADLKNELAEAAKAWLEACTKAHKSGFAVNANFGPNPFGQYVIHGLNLVKVY